MLRVQIEKILYNKNWKKILWLDILRWIVLCAEKYEKNKENRFGNRQLRIIQEDIKKIDLESSFFKRKEKSKIIHERKKTKNDPWGGKLKYNGHIIK